ncbi:MAG: hypothetical protein FGM32_02250 [Candidatus Kapabacteria bacterium]|nr:hypothetical protein [Candidatus Kapabacteria bacterium]
MKVMISILVFLLASVSALMACPACKDSYTKGGQNAAVGDAYSLSVMVMLAVPITILTIAIVMIARRLRQHPNSIA